MANPFADDELFSELFETREARRWIADNWNKLLAQDAARIIDRGDTE